MICCTSPISLSVPRRAAISAIVNRVFIFVFLLHFSTQLFFKCASRDGRPASLPGTRRRAPTQRRLSAATYAQFLTTAAKVSVRHYRYFFTISQQKPGKRYFCSKFIFEVRRILGRTAEC